MSESRSPSRTLHDLRRIRGLAAVEFVVTAPFVLLLLLAGAEVGRAFIHYATLSYGIRESARFVSENSIVGTTEVVALTSTTITRAKNIAVHGNIAGTGPSKLPAYQASHVQVELAGNDNVRVVATYPYQPMLGPLLPNFGFGTGPRSLNFNMQISVTMRAIS
jgi:Flp pilus assembly protein TadG